jgi:hypothetical protein
VSPSASPSPSSPIVTQVAKPTPEPEPVFNKNSTVFHHDVTLNQSTPTSYNQPPAPSWNTPGRPEKPSTGTIGFNIQTKNLEIWTGSKWLRFPMKRIT